jgi:hypothetical protein
MLTLLLAQASGFKRKCQQNLAVAFDFDSRFATIGPAFGADAVSDMVIAAVLADNQMIERERIVRAAFVAAAPRMAFLG